MKLRNYLWVFCAFALLILLVNCLSNDKSPDSLDLWGAQVATPSLQMEPNRAYNTGPIAITLTTDTAGASIYYTLDGSAPSATNGTLYTAPFNLTLDNSSPDTEYRGAKYRGLIIFQAIGIKEGLTNSLVAGKIFQLFHSEPIVNSNGAPVTGGPETGEGTGYNNGRVSVTLELAGGEITNLRFSSVGQTEGYWASAIMYARDFFNVMNSYDFVPVVSGASFSGNGIRTATKDAIDKILGQ